MESPAEHTDVPPFRKLPRELALKIFNYLPLCDRMAFLRSSAPSQCDILDKALFRHVAPLRVDQLSKIVWDKLSKHRNETLFLTFHFPDMDEWNHGKGRAGHIKLDAYLDKILHFYSEAELKLKTVAFTRTSVLDPKSYSRLKLFFATDHVFDTVVLPSPYPLPEAADSETLPFDVAIAMFEDVDAARASKPLNRFYRKGSPIHTARKLMNPDTHCIHKAEVFATGYNEDGLWEKLCRINESWQHLDEVVFHSFFSRDLHNNPLLRSAKGIKIFTLSNTRYTDVYDDDLQDERDLLVNLAVQNPGLQEFQYQQAVSTPNNVFEGITGDVLREFLTQLTSLQSLAFHQWKVLDEDMAAFAGIHKSTLRSFSWRSGNDNAKTEDIKKLVHTCPDLEALGLNANKFRIPTTAGAGLLYEDTFFEDFEKALKSLSGALSGLTNLRTLCLFTDLTKIAGEPPEGENKIKAAIMGMKVFTSEAKDNGLLSLRYIHVVHNRDGKSRGISSFRITFMPDNERTPGEIEVALVLQLPVDEEQKLRSLGGASEISMYVSECREMKDLYPSEETLYRFWDEESDEYQFGWLKKPPVNEAPKRKEAEEGEEKPKKKAKRSRGASRKKKRGPQSPSKS